MRLFRAHNTQTRKRFWVIARNTLDVSKLLIHKGEAANSSHVRVVGEYTKQYLETTDIAEIEDEFIASLKIIHGERRWVPVA